MPLLVGLLVIGCDETSDRRTTTKHNATENQSAESARAPVLSRIDWLDAHSDVTPERWLASRAARSDLKDDDPLVKSMRVELHSASQRFGDPPRMIANRAVQLETMLSEQGIDESALELIALLASVKSTDGPKRIFGSMCEYYFNLRQQGLGREAALEQLRETNPL